MISYEFGDTSLHSGMRGTGWIVASKEQQFRPHNKICPKPEPWIQHELKQKCGDCTAHLVAQADVRVRVIHLTAIPVSSALLDDKDDDGLRRCFQEVKWRESRPRRFDKSFDVPPLFGWRWGPKRGLRLGTVSRLLKWQLPCFNYGAHRDCSIERRSPRGSSWALCTGLGYALLNSERMITVHDTWYHCLKYKEYLAGVFNLP